MKTIGILGGLGPAATAYFNDRIVRICQVKYNAVQDYDFPPTIIYDVPVRSFDEKGIEDNVKVLRGLRKGLKTLEKDNVDFIVVDCNSVHLFIDKLRSSTELPITSIIEEVIKEIKKKRFTKIGLLGSQTTIDRNIYEHVLKNEKIKIIKPTKTQEKIITSVILKVMGGKNNKNDILKLRQITDNMVEKGAQSIIIGCTELSIPFARKRIGVPILDSSEILANEAIKLAKES